MLQTKLSDGVITLAFGDTYQSSRERLFDANHTYMTIGSENAYSKTFITGFTPNILHKGIDQADTLHHELNVVAVLAGDNSILKLHLVVFIEGIFFFLYAFFLRYETSQRG